jgi:flagellar basal body-associated protein FliL
MPKEDLGSRRARVRPPKKEETKGKWKRRMIQIISVVVILLMVFSGLIVFFVSY